MKIIKEILLSIYNNVYTKVFHSFNYELNKIIKTNDKILDIGCGNNSPIRLLSKEVYSVGVDSFQPSINKTIKEGIHNEYHKGDIFKIEKRFKDNSFDIVLALDIIEHLEKEKGNKLIKIMERLSKGTIIILTPNGFLKQKEYDNNPLQTHISGWEIKEMKEKGLKIIGMNGLKFLRGERSRIKLYPKLFWMIISDITQFYIRNHPKRAFQILCIKQKR